MNEDFSLEPFKKYIYAATAILLAILIGIGIKSSIETKNQAGWTALDSASSSDQLQTAFAEHKGSSAGAWIGFSLANTLYNEGKIKRAGAVFREVAEMEENYLTPHAMLGCIDALKSLGKEAEAQKYIDLIQRDFKNSIPAGLLKKS